ncbi:hypothetical protein [Kingella negevensis]|uniref:hypothetical protein n=1 Tax=Kingella negevensis TaxID=1522312 RepID=UPI00050A31A1|nr:hypothetical protein [Kingella negevensis]MDK4688662.1 hypothetical protein [Kingella negevensis]WII91594.1 hypothetical protein QEO93_03140 [Kingella negevensis]
MENNEINYSGYSGLIGLLNNPHLLAQLENFNDSLTLTDKQKSYLSSASHATFIAFSSVLSTFTQMAENNRKLPNSWKKVPQEEVDDALFQLNMITADLMLFLADLQQRLP